MSKIAKLQRLDRLRLVRQRMLDIRRMEVADAARLRQISEDELKRADQALQEMVATLAEPGLLDASEIVSRAAFVAMARVDTQTAKLSLARSDEGYKTALDAAGVAARDVRGIERAHDALQRRHRHEIQQNEQLASDERVAQRHLAARRGA